MCNCTTLKKLEKHNLRYEFLICMLKYFTLDIVITELPDIQTNHKPITT